MSTVSKVDYLKRYMSDGSDKKKKRKKIGKSVSPRIFDDDVDIKSLLPENQDVTMDDDLAENAPTVAEFVDERPLHVQQLEQYQDKIRWKSVEENNAEEGEIVSEEENAKEKNDLEDDGHISSDGELSDTNHSHESGGSDTSPSKPKKPLSDERATPPPKNPAQNSLSNISSKTKEGADRQEEQKPRNDSDTDDSMEEGRIPDDSGSEPSPRRRVRHNLESDKSPKRRHDSRSESESSPLRGGQSRRVRHDSDSDSRSNPLKRSLHDTDSDGSSSDSDQPAPRRRRQHSDAKPGRSTSPSPSKRAPKARPGSDSDGSTTRRRRPTSDSDHSPPRRRRHSSDSDQSPPHRRKPASDSDHSPRRRRPASDSDASPRRRRSVSDSDQSPRRRKRNSDSDNSPPRTSRRHSSDSDSSPPRRRAGKADRSTSRHRNNSSAVSKERRTQRGDSDSDLSPPRPGRNSSPVRRPQLDSRGRRQKTLGGAKAGLSTADDMRREARHMRYKEDRMFRQLDNTVSGKDAETIVRDRSTGRRRDLKQEQMRKNEEQKRKELKDQKYAEWGKGLKQKAKQEQAVQDTMHELSKPLARYKDDKDLDQMMREQDRAGDPMLAFIKKKKKPDKDGKERPTYKGPAPPPNRFNIMPGYRWDGVDRSNGFENQIYQKTAEKKATAAMAYKWSTEDM